MLAIMFVLTGCPLLTEKSMDEGSYDVPAWLPGNWAEVDSAGNKKDVYLLKKEDAKGNLKCYDVDGVGKPDMDKVRRVILSKVEDKVFLSIYNSSDNESDNGYYVYQFIMESKTAFTLKGVKEYSIDADSAPADILEYLKKHKDDASIYDPKEVSHYKKQ